MRYRNRKNGNIIETECSLSGKDWEALGTAQAAVQEAVKKELPKKERIPEFDEDDDSDLEEVAPVQQKAKGKRR